ncbi:MAG: hypothetical protein VCB43_13450 [Myxococcota bacterium]
MYDSLWPFCRGLPDSMKYVSVGLFDDDVRHGTVLSVAFDGWLGKRGAAGKLA